MVFLIIPTLSATAASDFLAPVVVVAQKAPESDPGITVQIDAKDAEQKQHSFVKDAIADHASTHIVQSGNGGKTSLFLRGGNSDQTLVLIDGMRANDPTLGAFDFGYLGTGGMAEIDIIPGPNTAPWGSGASAGVVHIKTARGSGKTTASSTIEGGSFGMNRQDAAIQGQKNSIDFNLGASHFGANGIPSTPAIDRTVPRQGQPDPYQNYALNARTGAQISDAWHVSLFNRIQKARTRYSDIFYADPAFQGLSKQTLNKIQGDGHLFNGRWKPTLSIGYMDQDRRDANEFLPSQSWRANYGKTTQLNWHNTIKVSSFYTLNLGMETEKQQYKSNDSDGYAKQASAQEDSIFIGNKFRPHTRLQVEIWGRLHKHSIHKNHQTYRGAISYIHPETKTKILTSYGTLIKSPSLFQLFDSRFGNAQLQPEKGYGWELGFEHPLQGKNFVVGSTFFRNRYSDMIDWVRSYLNIGKAETRGLESFMKITLSDACHVRAEHTYLHAKDLRTNLQLKQRPLHKLSLTMDYAMTENWSIGAGLIHTGKQADITRFPPYDRVYKGGITVVRAMSSYAIHQQCQLFGRVENLLDRRYTQPAGYQQPGFAVYGGIRVNL
ncbi:MAG: TonB-dependent receptor [Alphaproteobacteria bacterium]|nr:TonB-dependent receptor [Alphaproteobacteria bacterium]